MDPTRPTSKTCRTCEKAKPLRQFYQIYSSADGYSHHCMECYRAKIRERYYRKKELAKKVRR